MAHVGWKDLRKPMRVMYIIRGAFGMFGTNASYMFPSTLAKDHEVVVLAPKEGDKSGEVVYFNRHLQVRPLHSKGVYARLSEACMHIDEFKPDVVHVFYHPEALLYPFMARRLAKHKARWIVDVRSPITSDRWLVKQNAYWRARFLQRYVDAIVTPAADIAKTLFPSPSHPLQILPIGIDFSAIRPREISSCTHIQRFVLVSAVAQKRQIDIIVRAFQALTQRTSTAITLDIFGGGNALQSIRKLVRDLDMDSRVSVHGLVDQKTIFDRLADFDAGIAYVPKNFYDMAPPLKTLEYAAAGLPILASDTAAHREFSSAGLRLSCFENNTESFCRAALALLEKGSSPTDLENNRKVVMRYDWKEIVRRDLLPVYNGFLSLEKVA